MDSGKRGIRTTRAFLQDACTFLATPLFSRLYASWFPSPSLRSPARRNCSQCSQLLLGFMSWLIWEHRRHPCQMSLAASQNVRRRQPLRRQRFTRAPYFDINIWGLRLEDVCHTLPGLPQNPCPWSSCARVARIVN